LEALWTTWGLNQPDPDLLRKLLQAKDFRVRAAAVRVLRYNTHRFTDHAALLTQAAADPNGRVRLEAVVAASWLDNADGRKIVSVAAAQPLDEWTTSAVKTAGARLGGLIEAEVNEHPLPTIPPHLDDDGKTQFIAGHEVYFRDAHCATCHQPDGKGLDPAFPPLTNSPWVAGDPERLIKLTLHGLMGPFELNGKKYDGNVPMTPFGGMLNDSETAAVLTYIRNRFDNQAPPIKPEQVAKVRVATKERKMFYLTEELLKEHPMEKK
jgi:mono/diheme cytochrome c family protein